MARRKWLRPPWKRDSELSVRTPVTAVPVTADPEQVSAVTSSFPERYIGFHGNLKEYDYDAILRDKEGNMDKIYMLADYYVDKDPLIRGIIKEVYTPFSVSGKWKLVGKGEYEKRSCLEYYRRIGLDQFMRAVMYQYYKYGNVYIYMMPDGHLVTMPVKRMRIGNVTVNGTPIMEFNTGSVLREMRASGLISEKRYIQDDELSVRLGGYPKEIIEGVRAGKEWVQ